MEYSNAGMMRRTAVDFSLHGKSDRISLTQVIVVQLNLYYVILRSFFSYFALLFSDSYYYYKAFVAHSLERSSLFLPNAA